MNHTTQPVPRLVLTTGEPAGIGPDVVIMAAQKPWPAELVCVADRELLTARAHQLALPLELAPFSTGNTAKAHQPGKLRYIHVPLKEPSEAGQLNAANAGYVVATLGLAAELCRVGDASGLVTAPVQKSLINDAGIPFSGHTEFFAEAFNAQQVVMLLAAGEFRIALATTHLPLAAVPGAITRETLAATLRVLAQDLSDKFGIPQPRITVLGLNPHAGEAGHLGKEEIEVIKPVIDALRREGLQLQGPLPADTAFGPAIAQATDAYLAMYHDQGLPVLKYAGFGEAVNITLGLPVLRVSVDHGTALELAGTGKANPGSLETALGMAVDWLAQGV